MLYFIWLAGFFKKKYIFYMAGWFLQKEVHHDTRHYHTCRSILSKVLTLNKEYLNNQALNFISSHKCRKSHNRYVHETYASLNDSVFGERQIGT